MMRRIHGVSVIGLASLLSVSGGRCQGQALDRNKAPAPGPVTPVHVPTWTRTKLANGADLIVTQKRDLPLVAFSLNFVGGSYNYELADKLGTANFTAQMLSEGTKTKTADQLSEAQQ